MKRKTAIYLGWSDVPVSAEVNKILRKTFDIRYSRHCGPGEKVDQGTLADLEVDFLFSFGPVIASRRLLDSLSVAAINFHTAPPRWPGRGSVSFALFEGDREFGVTAHLMTENIDAGPILRVLRFPIRRDDSVETLHSRTLAQIPRLVETVVDNLAKNDWRVVPSREKWARKALRRKDLLDLMQIHATDSAAVAARKIRACAHPRKPGPYVVKHGRRFWYLENRVS